jgi:hypothetical protein
MGIADFIAARALNGILIAGLGLMLCLMVFILQNIFGKHRSSWQRMRFVALGVMVLAILFATISIFWKYDQLDEGKLVNLIGDMQIAIKVDKNQSWVRDGRMALGPVDNAGRKINSSTYERVSWFMKGLELIRENPLGNGISHRAFGYYMRAQFPGSIAQMTHSAWIDYTLGLGIPSLFLVWVAIWGVSWRGFKQSSQEVIRSYQNSRVLKNPALTTRIGLWLILGLFCLWFIGEVSEREYLEHYFFLIAIFSTALKPINMEIPPK